MGKVLNFGELLLRICPDIEGDWLKNNNLPFYVGGAELNVATALALWGIPSAYLTALPDNSLTEQLTAYIQGLNIDTSAIQYTGERVGLYYLHQGKDLKNSGVIYDRAGSSFATLKTGTINWDEVLKDVSWFHFSAICPAVSLAAAEVCEEALREASARNIRISVDLNYRAKLWKYGKEPIEVLPRLVQYCDVVMGNLWAAEKMLGIPVPQELAIADQKELYLQQAAVSAKQLINDFPKCKVVANTFRFDAGAGVRYYSALFTANQLLVSKQYSAETILNKVGSGDCYMAGLIYGFYQDKPAAEILEFATAAAFSKLFVEGDATTVKANDIKEKVRNYED
ncbi:carbohydrate kinase [Pedobacter lusitanus]|uniref:Contig34, whole genome shotgun sequence n=1 Tax=Pedobacter lusitanus TaxID=1503925 RepID=A0A0D0GJL2_9SPHI|nr:sugar kinase [Pedobacter lusitanus]KIO77447.1 carbohydrate kinase [Pedobacter lusitanus]